MGLATLGVQDAGVTDALVTDALAPHSAIFAIGPGRECGAGAAPLSRPHLDTLAHAAAGDAPSGGSLRTVSCHAGAIAEQVARVARAAGGAVLDQARTVRAGNAIIPRVAGSGKTAMCVALLPRPQAPAMIALVGALVGGLANTLVNTLDTRDMGALATTQSQ